mmetsp:Transcript_64800/g.190094  ORF Transcript_64800/g.190094 Transcript_64800/m.190094 type:complete len:204 (+) Transcript_64800:485-1096(+)
MALMMLTFLIRSPIWILSGSICAAEREMPPGDSFTGGITRLSKSSAQAIGPRRPPLPDQRMPATFRPQAFWKGTVVPQLEMPKEMWIPRLKLRFSIRSTSLSSRNSPTMFSPVDPASTASTSILTTPLPAAGRTEPGGTLNLPTETLSVCPMKTSPSSAVEMSMLYGFRFRHATWRPSPKWMLFWLRSNLSRVAACVAHSVAV